MTAHSFNELIYNWDFTDTNTPLIDTINGATITLHSASILSGQYLNINAVSAYASVPVELKEGYIYELDIDSIVDNTGSSHGRFIMGSNSEGFIFADYAGSQTWAVYDGSWHVVSQNIPVNKFDGKTLKLIYDKNKYITVYSDDELVYQSGSAITWRDSPYSNYFTIGGSSQSMHTAHVKALRVYEMI